MKKSMAIKKENGRFEGRTGSPVCKTGKIQAPGDASNQELEMLERKKCEKILFEALSRNWSADRIRICSEALFQKTESEVRFLNDSDSLVNHIHRFNERYTVTVLFPDLGPIAIHYSPIRKRYGNNKYKAKAIIDAPHLFSPITTYMGIHTAANQEIALIKPVDKDLLDIMKRAPKLNMSWMDIIVLPLEVLGYVQLRRNLHGFLMGGDSHDA